jgi:hypothetical protein
VEPENETLTTSDTVLPFVGEVTAAVGNGLTALTVLVGLVTVRSRVVFTDAAMV